MREVIMQYSGEGEDLHDLRKVGDLVRCRDCVRYDKHDKRCKHWNHKVGVNWWCCFGQRREMDE